MLASSSFLGIIELPIIIEISKLAAETIAHTGNEDSELRVIERKVMKTIYGNKRGLMKPEIPEKVGGEAVVKEIKAQRIKWLGHAWRQEPTFILLEYQE